jgi:integrase
VQKSHLLCRKDNKHFSRTCKAVKNKRDDFMRTINLSQVSEADMLVTDFCEQRYLPFVTENMKPSTVSGYKQVWNQHLKAHFAGVTLQGYRTHVGSALLLSLTKTQVRRTLNHIRSLASGVFTHAVNEGRLESNPWHDVKILGKVRAPKPTHAYTPEAAEAISNALIDNPTAQVVFCLAAFLGLRPGEISALKWQDVEWNDDSVSWIHVRRAAWRAFVGTTKTEESVASVPLIEPVKSMLLSWKKLTAGEWVFPNRSNNPMQMEGFQKRVIAPVVAKSKALKEKGIKWHGLYAGRRAAATLLVQLTGNAVAAQFVLRHKNLTTTTAFYVKPVQTAAVEGMKLVEETLATRKVLAESNGK